MVTSSHPSFQLLVLFMQLCPHLHFSPPLCHSSLALPHFYSLSVLTLCFPHLSLLNFCLHQSSLDLSISLPHFHFFSIPILYLSHLSLPKSLCCLMELYILTLHPNAMILMCAI